jgi:hypothetical protein
MLAWAAPMPAQANIPSPSEARLDTLLPDARKTTEWLRETLALDVVGHEPSTRFRPAGR